MSGKIIAGVIGFVVLVLLVQNYILGDDGGPEAPGRTGVAPTATLPAQTPEAISLGQVQSSGAASPDGAGTTGGGTYVVQTGDTLGTIAANMNVAPEAKAEWIAQVLELNGIPDARLLQAGQELTLPGAPAASRTPAPGATGVATGTPGSGPGIVVATPTPGRAGGGRTYIVVSGDTAFGIAEKLCVQGAAAWVNELVALNNIDPAAMTIGQELELPAGTPAQCP